MRKKPLEISLYVAGAGAFGVLLRWLENQLAFDDLGLADPSAFHVMVPGFIIICCLVYWRFLRQMDRQNLYIPREPERALGTGVKLQLLLGGLAGAVMVLGGLLLFVKSETDKYVGMTRFVALLAALSGAAWPMAMLELRRRKPRAGLLCLLQLLPMLLYASWLILSYRNNTINSVPLSYGLEMLVLIVTMIAYFRLAGFAFGTPRPRRCMLAAMLGAMLCIMSLADERYMGMELILLASAGQLLLAVWILVQNQQEKERRVIVKKDDGFEHLDEGFEQP